MSASSLSPSFSCRRAATSDAETLRGLLLLSGSSTSFGVVDVDSAIETNVVSLVATDAKGTIVGFASASDSLGNTDCLRVLVELQDVVSDAVVSPGNSLFLHVLSVHPSASASETAVAAALLRGIFSNVADVDHLVAAPVGALPASISSTFLKSPVTVPTTSSSSSSSTVYLCPRQSSVPTLYVRPARVEDNDDLAPIFQELEPGRFGEFFLAEVIEKQTEKDKVLIGEGPEGRAVGLMAFTSEIPSTVIHSCFETAPYAHFAKRPASLLARDARVAVLEARSARDWYSVLTHHGEELQAVFDSIPAAESGETLFEGGGILSPVADFDVLLSPLSPDGSSSSSSIAGSAAFPLSAGAAPSSVSSPTASAASPTSDAVGVDESNAASPPAPSLTPVHAVEERVLVADVAAVFDAKGDTWGYVGVGGAKLGVAMLVDTELLRPGVLPSKAGTITRAALNAAVAAFAESREAFHRRMRVAAWYAGIEKGSVETKGVEDDENKEGEEDAAVEVHVPAPSAHAPAAAAAGAAAAGKPTIAVPVAAAAGAAGAAKSAGGAAASSASSFPGRRILDEELAALSIALDQSRKERLRAAQQAVIAAQKEVDASVSVERAAIDALAKEAHERELAAAAAGKGPAHHPTGTYGAKFSGRHIKGRRVSIQAQTADARLERASRTAAAAQVELTQPLRLSLTTIAEAVNRRLARMGAAMNDVNSGEDLLGELKDLFAEAIPSIGPTSATVAAGGVVTEATKQLVAAVLDTWEKRALPRAAAPVIVITSSAAGERYLLSTPAAGGVAAAASPAEAAVAEVTSSLLSLPHIHLPSLLSQMAADFAAAETAVAAAIERMRIEDEKKKKAEEEAAKKALASAGGPKKDKKKDKKDEAPREIPSNKLVDPHKQPLAAIMQNIASRSAELSGGFVLTGVPSHDRQACEEVASALHSVGLPPVLNLHVEEGPVDGAASSSSSSNGRRSSHSRSSGRLSVNVSDRMVHSASMRRASITPMAADGSFARQHPPPITTHAAGNIFGPTTRVDGEHERLAAAAASLARAEGTHIALDGGSFSTILKEPLIATLLREGLLRRDPTEAAAAHVAGITEKEAEEASKSAAPNAFLITLFCLGKENETRFLDLLAGAFEAFPDREYALLMQPYSAGDLPMLRRFTQVTPLSRSTLNQVLYACHRDSLLAPALATVRRATSLDRPAIASLAALLPERGAFMDAVVAAEQRSHLPLSLPSSGHGGRSLVPARIAAFVAEVEGQVVGVIVLSATGASVDAVSASAVSFQVDAFLEPDAYAVQRGDGSGILASTGIASLLHVCVNPVFLPVAANLLRQATRLFGGRGALLYRQPSSVLGAHIVAPLPPAVRLCFGLAIPRHLPDLTPDEKVQRGEAQDAAAVVEAAAAAAAGGEGAPGIPNDGVSYAAHTVVGMTDTHLSDPRYLDHALHVFCARMSSLPQTTLNTRIVIVGASDAALSAVSTLIFHPGLILPHVTLVAPGGLPQPRDPFHSPPPFVPGREFTSFELSRLPLSSHVTVVDDLLVRIGRKERSIGLATGRSIIRYDRLLLLPGLTESTWSRLGYADPSHLPRGMHTLTSAEALGPLTADVEALASIIAEQQQEGGSGSGSSSSASSVSGIVVEPDVDDPQQVVVYGDGLDSLTAISGLLGRGIPGSKILHLRPVKTNVEASQPDVSVSAAAAAGSNSAPAAAGAATAPANLFMPSLASLDAAVEERGQLLQSLLPSPPAPWSEGALFAARAVASVLDAAGVRQIVGAELLGVSGEVGEGQMRLDEDGAPIVNIPGLAMEVRVRIKTPPQSDSAAASPIGAASESDSADLEDSLDEGKTGEDAPPPPPAPTSEVITIRAALILCANERDVDPRFFNAVNRCGIVYDGRLVVDHRFVATDQAVYGGGSVAKFSRRYRAPLPMQAYDSREVGAAVAASLVADLEGSPVPTADKGAVSLAPLLPRFVRPKTTKAMLPGGLYYVAARLPLYDFGEHGREIVTHVDARETSNNNTDGSGTGLRHSRLVLSRFRRVAEVTYVGTDPVEPANLCAMVGQSSAYLIGLERRVDNKALPDLIEFLRGNWASALRLHRFGGLVAALRAVLGDDPAVQALQKAAEELLQTASEGEDAAGAVLKVRDAGVGVSGASLPSDTRRSIEKRVIAFLVRNRHIIPGYLCPTTVTV